MFQAGGQQASSIGSYLGGRNQMNSRLGYEFVIVGDFGALDAMFGCVLKCGVRAGLPRLTELIERSV
jgi:hypothetical protein